MKTLKSFEDIGDQMLWKGSALGQIERFNALGKALETDPEVVSTHTSKSITLPVVRYNCDFLILTLRDNFYGINVWVQSQNPINMPYSTIAVEHDMDWYESEIQRKRNYCYKGWTDEEMDDPRILRVKLENRWSEVRAEEKERWIARYHSTEWYSKDWASGKLVAVSQFAEIPFPPETVFYVLGECFAEGMDRLWSHKPPLYEPGSHNFLMQISQWDDVERILKALK